MVSKFENRFMNPMRIQRGDLSNAREDERDDRQQTTERCQYIKSNNITNFSTCSSETYSPIRFDLLLEI